MFRIKICGITRPEDAIAAAEAGADAIGFNFYPRSPRFVGFPPNTPLAVARERFAKAGHACQWVGVFVNSDDVQIHRALSEFKLDAVQLHGDETPGMVAQLRPHSVIRARRMDERGVAGIAEDLTACGQAGRVPNAVLVDAFTPGQYGGTGETVSWAGLADYRQWLGDVPLILAGGLTPENVAEAIRTVRPYGVDTASGVESSPGVKDQKKMQSFIRAAQSAFEQLEAI